MSQLFTLTYVLLCCLILLETLVLCGVLRKAMWFQEFYSDSGRPDRSHKSYSGKNAAPKFSLPSLETGKHIQTIDLRGQSTLLCFVSPQPTALYRTLMAALHAWWHRMDGRVYLVCTGTIERCRQLVGAYANGFPLGKIICDEAGVLARNFGIDNTPQAVELDQNADVRRFGRPESLELGTEDKKSGDAAEDTRDSGQLKWPDDRLMSGAAFARVDTTVSCVLTRFRLNSPLSMIPFYLAFRRVRREARDIAGLMEALFLFENLRTCYTLSLWKDDWSIVEFGRVRTHIDAANSAFSATYRGDLKRAEIWSAQFRLWAVSCHNLNWDGLDTQAALGEQWARREEVAQMSACRKE